MGLEISRMITLLAKLPGLGPRSAQRVALYLMKNRHGVLDPLLQVLSDARDKIHPCGTCGNLDSVSPCGVCQDPKRDPSQLCVVGDVADLWALERSGATCGYYHILGGYLSAIDSVRPDDLNVASLLHRVQNGEVEEVVLALSATVEGQTTAHYLLDILSDFPLKVTHLAQGVPIGGELDYLDEGTLVAAMRERRAL